MLIVQKEEWPSPLPGARPNNRMYLIGIVVFYLWKLFSFFWMLPWSKLCELQHNCTSAGYRRYFLLCCSHVYTYIGLFPFVETHVPLPVMPLNVCLDFDLYKQSVFQASPVSLWLFTFGVYRSLSLRDSLPWPEIEVGSVTCEHDALLWSFIRIYCWAQVPLGWK